MKRAGHTVTDADLVAHVDGERSAVPEVEILAHLSAHPADTARVQTWRRQNEALKAAYHGAAAEPLPVSLSLTHPRAPRAEPARTNPNDEPPLRQVLRFERRRQQRNSRTGIAVVAFGAGGLMALYLAMASGYAPSLPEFFRPPSQPIRVETATPAEQSLQLARRAGEAHRTFAMARESQHPGEITLAQDPSLALWLSRRVGIAIRLPDFSTEGFRFTGGRITPGELGPAAFLLYESGAGERVGLFVARIVSDETLAPVYREDRATGTLTWTSGGAGFVLTALGGRERLQALWRLAPGNS